MLIEEVLVLCFRKVLYEIRRFAMAVRFFTHLAAERLTGFEHRRAEAMTITPAAQFSLPFELRS